MNAPATTPVQKPHGTLYKATQIALGVASLAAIVMSFIPGVNLIGAAVQGGITLVQTGMALAEGNKKKAALSFGIGTLLTVASLVPFLGAVGNVGRVAVDGAGIAGEAAGTAQVVGAVANTTKVVGGTAEAVGATASLTGDAVQSTSFLTKVGNFFKPVKDFFKPVGEFVRNVMHGARDLIYRIPGIKPAVNFVSNGWAKHVSAPLVGVESRAVTWGANNARVAKAGRYMAENPTLQKGLVYGANAGGIGLSMIDDTPPGNLANPDTYDFSKEGQSSQWRSRIEAERLRAANSTQEH